MSKTWEDVTKFYIETYGISNELVELMAISDVLLMCVSGASNDSISKFLELGKEDIKDILDSVFNFEGFKEDLDFNPYMIFCNLPRKDFKLFVKETVGLSNYNNTKLKTLFNMCKIYSKIEHRLDTEWI